MAHILVSLLSPFKEFLRHSGTGYLWDLKLIWPSFVISQGIKGNQPKPHHSFIKTAFSVPHLLPKATAADQVALVLFHHSYPSAQTLKTVLFRTRKGAWGHLPIPYVTSPWIAQGASLYYREVALDVSCPLIQVLLKSVRMLPLKSLQAALATCLTIPLLCIATAQSSWEKGRSAQRHTQQTGQSGYMVPSSLKALLETNKERCSKEAKKEEEYLSHYFLSLIIISVFKKLKLTNMSPVLIDVQRSQNPITNTQAFYCTEVI